MWTECALSLVSGFPYSFVKSIHKGILPQTADILWNEVVKGLAQLTQCIHRKDRSVFLATIDEVLGFAFFVDFHCVEEQKPSSTVTYQYLCEGMPCSYDIMHREMKLREKTLNRTPFPDRQLCRLWTFFTLAFRGAITKCDRSKSLQ